MTNPNHTDTSRIADLRFQVSEKMPINHSDLSCLFDRIEALEAENERLREALIRAESDFHLVALESCITGRVQQDAKRARDNCRAALEARHD